MVVALAACAVAELPDLEARALDTLQSDADWESVVDWSMWHHVGPQLCRWLESRAASVTPAAVFGPLKLYAERNRADMQAAARELAGISDTLAAAGIPLLAYKGPILAQQAYGDLSLRTSCDLDFLIAPEAVDDALTCLEPLGYRLSRPLSPAQIDADRRYYGQYQIVRQDQRFTIEMHWSLTHRVIAVDFDYAGFWERSTTVDVEGTGVRTFSLEDALLVVCVHGTKEHWHRLKWIGDVAQMLARHPNLDWQAALERARATGTARMLCLGAMLANRLLGASVPDDIRTAIAADPALDRLAAPLFLALCSTRQRSQSITRVNRFRWGVRERYRDKLTYAARTVLMPRDIHYEMVRLPRPLAWLYYPLRWVHDYVLLPLWRLGRRAPDDD